MEHPLNKRREAEGKSPANVILMRGCGIKIKAEPFNERFNTKAVTICPTAIIAGITMSLGFDRVQVEGATGDYHTDLTAKARAAYDLLYRKGYEFCFLHVKPFDEAGHDSCIERRLDIARRIEEMMRTFMEKCKDEKEDCLVVITGDHSTPLYRGDHSFEPVNFTVASKDAFWQQKPFFLCDQCQVFSEIEAAKGSFGRFPGKEIMPLVFKIRERLDQKGFA